MSLHDVYLAPRGSASVACRDVLELVAPGAPELWRRERPAVVAGAVEAAKWDLEAFSYEAFVEL